MTDAERIERAFITDDQGADLIESALDAEGLARTQEDVAALAKATLEVIRAADITAVAERLPAAVACVEALLARSITQPEDIG